LCILVFGFVFFGFVFFGFVFFGFCIFGLLVAVIPGKTEFLVCVKPGVFAMFQKIPGKPR